MRMEMNKHQGIGVMIITRYTSILLGYKTEGIAKGLNIHGTPALVPPPVGARLRNAGVHEYSPFPCVQPFPRISEKQKGLKFFRC
jgi:hypothetical protein